MAPFGRRSARRSGMLDAAASIHRMMPRLVCCSVPYQDALEPHRKTCVLMGEPRGVPPSALPSTVGSSSRRTSPSRFALFYLLHTSSGFDLTHPRPPGLPYPFIGTRPLPLQSGQLVVAGS